MLNKKRWFQYSYGLSVIFTLLIGLMWYAREQSYHPNPHQLVTPEDIDTYLDAKQVTRKRIPTGLFIQSFRFNSTTEVNFTGYIWQKYSKNIYSDVPDSEIPLGFVLPEAVDSGDNVMPRLVYRGDLSQNQELIIWYFEATLRQNFDYRHYPFDHKQIWIRMSSGLLDVERILIPDLLDYASTKPGDTFGLDEDIVLGPWVINETFFEYQEQHYDTNFGFGGSPRDADPELYFNIIVKRQFWNAFIVNLIPLLVVAILLFAILMMITGDGEKAKIFGFSTSNVIGVCSGLFFVVMLAHIQLRREIPSSGILYLESFYLLMYSVILAVGSNSYLFSMKMLPFPLRWLQYRDNLIAKVIYWPLILGASTVITFFNLLWSPGSPKDANHSLRSESPLYALSDQAGQSGWIATTVTMTYEISSTHTNSMQTFAV